MAFPILRAKRSRWLRKAKPLKMKTSTTNSAKPWTKKLNFSWPACPTRNASTSVSLNLNSRSSVSLISNLTPCYSSAFKDVRRLAGYALWRPLQKSAISGSNTGKASSNKQQKLNGSYHSATCHMQRWIFWCRCSSGMHFHKATWLTTMKVAPKLLCAYSLRRCFESIHNLVVSCLSNA